ncbi:glycosyltransferase family 4 protein [Ramlibacter alkalitolerans]|uniref:Glycosyltransferase family 4 protein n=1 Tax=Ramlibacter alkalitolerans TaxID=2039631 RepID=A0ABS1JHY5_9BURK|nr:glycosyltransferase family 4 protein [Ramlibacter alkalitolerans]MBL0423835.1 glycosyltransferase family 4 protein [Ramlibacter alkalitolerans]
MNRPPRKLLFLVVEDAFFYSHFLPRARAARDAGLEVVVVTNIRQHGARIRAEGFRVLPLNMARGSLHWLEELASLARIRAIYKREKPDIVHQIAMKPVLYGGFLAHTLPPMHVVNALVGMGWVFTSNQLKARLLRPLVKAVLRFTLQVGDGMAVFENPDDLRHFVATGAVDPERAVLIRGAGVDVRHFRPVPPKPRTPVVSLVARMLYDKGVAEFVEAARLLRARGVPAHFRLVGGLDAVNPSCVPEAVLREWMREGLIEWLGHQQDILRVWQDTDIACLPSYREGLPKSSLEALACGLPLVTTDVPGCRETVTHEENGLLVPPKDAVALANALERLVRDAALRRRFGQRGRERAVREFSDDVVIAATLKVYHVPAPSASPAPPPSQKRRELAPPTP